MYKVKNARAELFFRSNLVPMAFPLPGGGAPHPQVRENEVNEVNEVGLAY